MRLTATDLKQKALTKGNWTLNEKGGITFFTSPLLSQIDSLTHAFTTRVGGTSPEPLEWFNLGRHWNTEESRLDASANRIRLCEALSLNFSRLVVPGQVHSAHTAWISKPTHLPDVDGVATVERDLPILLHYADCVPIIIFEQHLQAVCVVHAGWRGTAAGIVRGAVRLLQQEISAKPELMVAAIGPAIGDCCYQVGDDVSRQLGASVNDSEGLIRFENEIPHPDLQAINAMQLLEAGVSEIDVSSHCTACHPDLFYSHRHSAGQTGRQGAIAGLKLNK